MRRSPARRLSGQGFPVLPTERCGTSSRNLFSCPMRLQAGHEPKVVSYRACTYVARIMCSGGGWIEGWDIEGSIPLPTLLGPLTDLPSFIGRIDHQPPSVPCLGRGPDSSLDQKSGIMNLLYHACRRPSSGRTANFPSREICENVN